MAINTPNNSIYINEGLWLKSTNDVMSLMDLSISSCFAIDIKKPPIKGDESIFLLAYEAVLPGTSLELAQVSGDVQGIVEQYPIKRVYPQVDVSFYIRRSYDTIKFFESWIEKIAPLQGRSIDKGSFIKFNYPEVYECDINIIKYERDMRPSAQRLSKGSSEGIINDPKSTTYTLLNAYPINIISIPVSYEQSSILRTTITFNYDRYVYHTHKGRSITPVQGT
jgi:hypothetical protein